MEGEEEEESKEMKKDREQQKKRTRKKGTRKEEKEKERHKEEGGKKKPNQRAFSLFVRSSVRLFIRSRSISKRKERVTAVRRVSLLLLSSRALLSVRPVPVSKRLLAKGGRACALRL